ncbi:UBP-type zinc finger domain-containing protein [Streptomyces sp. NPDC052396]|uniref:UBP-type zinc finger domain-containing protein n=1 Tax=Streptomyces sp. NPDC052396 TaxID=3365689 RepID=UPI0037CEF0AC
MIDCIHLGELPRPEPAPLGATCPRCAEGGGHPVQLRMCLACGFVGCCDSSAGRHATAHFEETGHPVMRSFEPGQSWRWCYVDKHLV